MRTLRSGLATILATGLLAGAAVGVAAQRDGGPAYVTGTLAADGERCIGDDGRWNECPLGLEASDPAHR